jgi:Ni/Co efflux regulator RcnB
LPGTFPGRTAGPPGRFIYRGRQFTGIHAAPFVYPQGYGYRQWGVGTVLPPFFLIPDYYYPEWAALGLEPPPPGCQWVRYGPDLLLVDLSSGQVLDTAYGVFY